MVARIFGKEAAVFENRDELRFERDVDEAERMLEALECKPLIKCIREAVIEFYEKNESRTSDLSDYYDPDKKPDRDFFWRLHKEIIDKFEGSYGEICNRITVVYVAAIFRRERRLRRNELEVEGILSTGRKGGAKIIKMPPPKN